MLRLTQAEMEVLTRKAKEAKMPREAFIRRVLNGAKIIAKPPADYYKLIVEVRKVGSNLNQLVKRAQSLDFIDIPALQKCWQKSTKQKVCSGRLFRAMVPDNGRYCNLGCERSGR